MDERVGLLPQQEEVSHHPAVLAWRRLNPAAGEPAEILVLKKRFKSNIYRIKGPGPTTASLVAKYCRREVAAHERIIYEQILPSLAVTVPRYFGFVEGDGDYDWLFLEYVEGERYSRERRDHSALAGRWLGILHTSAWSSVTSISLPDLGPQHYLALLRNARGKFCRSLSELHLPAEELAVVRAVVSQCDFLESHWKQVEQWSSRMPRTLVHGDFKPRNAVIGLAGAGPALFPFDWEASGWGVPAEDLAYVDLASYHAAIQSDWPEVGLRELQCMKVLGRIFRGLSEFSWESAKFDPNWEVSTVKLRIYQTRMAEAIEKTKWGE
ncbi:MAG TPA: aminoglycoside phosphotransferase family protein [Candidatus Dormibacteraeota bacterium]|nr:aminoglycoside phosphotransferase family protein [Candidatus Dormibacteraeota bacterium]